MNLSRLKIALVHDWLTGMRGGEKVLEVLCEMFSQADIFTLLHNKGSVSPIIESHPIQTSFINRLPLAATRYRNYLPLFPTAIELFDFKNYDLILSTSHCVAKGVRTPPDALHISYLHTPMRYVWDMYEEYFGRERLNFITRMIIPPIANYLRMWDVSSSNRVDYFIANSRHVAKRIRKYYRREATVIHPPVDTELFRPPFKKEDYYLIVSALVPYKKIDLAIEVFNRSRQKLIIVGDGPEKKQLQRLAGKNIRFYPYQPSEELRDFYGKAKALIFPGEEDFGIVPVEAQSAGTPVIAYGRGGALETVIGFDGSNEKKCTGIFFKSQTVRDLQNALKQFEQLQWDAGFIHQHAQKFNRERFRQEMSSFIQEKWEAFQGDSHHG